MLNVINEIHLKRKILSISIIILAILFFYLSNESNIRLMASISVIFIFLDFIHYKFGNQNPLIQLYFKIYPRKSHEYVRFLSDASIFFISTLIMLIIFSKEIVIYSIIIFIVADVASHIFGIIVHKGKLFWNHDKTWGGVIPSFLFAFVIGYLIVKLMPNFNLSLLYIAISSIIVAILGTSNNFDNIAMPWGSAIFLALFI